MLSGRSNDCFLLHFYLYLLCRSEAFSCIHPQISGTDASTVNVQSRDTFLILKMVFLWTWLVFSVSVLLNVLAFSTAMNTLIKRIKGFVLQTALGALLGFLYCIH